MTYFFFDSAKLYKLDPIPCGRLITRIKKSEYEKTCRLSWKCCHHFQSSADLE